MPALKQGMHTVLKLVDLFIFFYWLPCIEARIAHSTNGRASQRFEEGHW